MIGRLPKSPNNNGFYFGGFHNNKPVNITNDPINSVHVSPYGLSDLSKLTPQLNQQNNNRMSASPTLSQQLDNKKPGNFSIFNPNALESLKLNELFTQT